jgi:hypothetical protein
MGAYLARQVADESRREVLGPLLPGSGASGVVVHRGRAIAEWGDPDVPEMLYSAVSALNAKTPLGGGVWASGRSRIRTWDLFLISVPQGSGRS